MRARKEGKLRGEMEAVRGRKILITLLGLRKHEGVAIWVECKEWPS